MWRAAAAKLAARCSQPLSRFSSEPPALKNEFSNEIAAAGPRTCEHKRGGALEAVGGVSTGYDPRGHLETDQPSRLVTVKELLTLSFNCRRARSPNFKNLAVLEVLLKKRAGTSHEHRNTRTSCFCVGGHRSSNGHLPASHGRVVWTLRAGPAGRFIGEAVLAAVILGHCSALRAGRPKND